MNCLLHCRVFRCLLLTSVLSLLGDFPLPAQDSPAGTPDTAAALPAPATTQPAETSAATASTPAAAPAAAPPQDTQLEGVFEAVQSVPVIVNLEDWAELKVIEAVAHGTPVQQGTVLIRLETKDLDLAIRDTQLELKLDRLALEEAQAKFELLDRSQRLALKAAKDADRLAGEELKEFLTRGRDERLDAVKQSEISSRNRLAYEEEELKQLEKMYEADDLTEETEEIILKRTRDSVDAAQYAHKMMLSSARESREYTIPRAEDDLQDAVQQAALALQETRDALPRQRRQQELQLKKLQDALAKKEKHLARLRGSQAHGDHRGPRRSGLLRGMQTRQVD